MSFIGDDDEGDEFDFSQIKRISGQYKAVGCVGCALVTSNVQNFKIVLYTGKQQYIAYSTVNYESTVTIQPNNYCSFYDDNLVNWSLLFKDHITLAEFAKKIAFCKVQSLTKLQIVCQDIKVDSSDGMKVEANDALELKYKAWTVEDKDKLGTMFDNSESSENRKPFRIKLSNKGNKWQEMLIGMRVGTQRFCLVPLEFKDEFAGIIEKAILYESTLLVAFEFELIRIKPRDAKDLTPRHRVETISSVGSDEVGKDLHHVEPESKIENEETIAVSRSSSKSDIMSRVAKVGTQIMLPPRSKSIDEGDSNEQIEENIKVKPLPKPRQNSFTSTSIANVETNVENRSMENSVSTLPPPNTMITVTQQKIDKFSYPPYLMNPMPVIDPSVVNKLASEVQTSNSEMRLNLSKISDKVESLCNKMDDFKNSASIFNSASSLGMDSTLLLASIHRIVTENNSLKSEIEEKNLKIDRLNEKMCELASQKLKSASKDEEKFDEIEIEKKKLEDELKKTISLLEALKHEKYSIERQLEDVQKENALLLKEKEKLTKNIEELKARIDTIKTNSVEVAISDREIENKIKKIMNVLYRHVSSVFDSIDEDMLKKEEVIKLLANSIRSVTLQALENKSENSSPQPSPFHIVEKVNQNGQKENVRAAVNNEEEQLENKANCGGSSATDKVEAEAANSAKEVNELESGQTESVIAANSEVVNEILVSR
ncbi:FK506-binding protein 15-like protein [Dinothrombium tinctorium]|uniref:peptidylprolyl isomerase n=1 Tax=Dinothrombium tinctorium TaxID=1965070 RepID=A0A3S3NNB6_9ACAR|nr:FK506-binding protein 15-like protein [Dinothrombium tinctorium]